MYLKAVELQGFKSFPDKTRLSFENNITAIVGPNGSGKSNISDAIRWVMGEQRTKQLRGENYDEESGLCIGRSWADSPDIDWLVYFDSGKPDLVGQIVPVFIRDTRDGDLIGTYAGKKK